MQHNYTSEDRVFKQQIRLLYGQSSTAVIFSVTVALLPIFYLWQESSATFLSVWFFSLIFISLFRLLLFHRFASIKPKDPELINWLYWHILVTFIGGAIWGGLGILYEPGWTTSQQVLLLVVIAGIATAAISAYAAVLKVYVAFLIPVLLPLAVLLFIDKNQNTESLSLIVLIFGAGLFGTAKKFHNQIVDTVRLAIEQQYLQDEVSSGTVQLEATTNALHLTKQRFEQTLESSLDGFWDWDMTHNQLYLSPRWKEQLGYKDEQLPNEFSSWESRLHPEDKDRIINRLQDFLRKPSGIWEEEFQLRHKNGSYKWILARATPTFDSDKKLIRLIGVHIDITDRVIAEREAQHLAYYDWLTELPNRLLFSDRVEHALAQAKRSKHQIFILFIDLDRFKHINDSLGHPAGDNILQNVAGRLAEKIRVEDTLARLGGDEFSVIIENTSESRNVAIVAEKLLSGFNDPFEMDGHEFYLGASIGISVFPQDGDEATTLLKNADAAMYKAKRSGGNCFHFYTEELTNKAYQHFTLEAGLREALQKDQFHVYYQPKVCLKTARIVGAEALLRWQHPEKGFISPDEFIPVAEESGLIMPIGEWVLEQACNQTESWKKQGLNLEHMAVNVSGMQLQHKEFVTLVRKVLDSSGLQAGCLELEITENFLMEDVEVSAKFLEDLRHLGISIAIDDFGTGYSSLAHLTRFPVNKLKIDRSFITNVCKDPQNAAISRTIISLGHTLNMKVVAEGIELVKQLEFLTNEGCDEGQGYYMAKPLPRNEFFQFVKHYKHHVNDFPTFEQSTVSVQGTAQSAY